LKRFFTSLVRFIPKYFISETIMNEITFLISFLTCSLLVYRKDTVAEHGVCNLS
jgi:hypothetical protein